MNAYGLEQTTEQLLEEAKTYYLATRDSEDSVRRDGFRRYMAAMDVASAELDSKTVAHFTN